MGLPLASRKRILPPLEEVRIAAFHGTYRAEQATEHLVGFHLETETFKCLGYGAFLFADKAGRYRRHLGPLKSPRPRYRPTSAGLRLP